MGLFSRHIDRLLSDLGAGDLSPRQTRRLLEHAKRCERCGALVDRVLAAQRVLQGSLFEPSEQEQAAWAAGAAAVVAKASAAQPARAPSRTLFLAFAGAAVACLALFVLWSRPAAVLGPDFGVRGDGKSAPATLRLYCAATAGELVELSEGNTCQVGSSLGFAAGALAPLERVRLVVRENGSPIVDAKLQVLGKPGAEEALEVSARLNQPGTVRVEAAFAETVDGLEASKVRLAREVVVVETK